MIRENKDGSIVVNGLTERVVSSAEHTLQCLQHGAQFRTTGSTLMNAVSSRSHAIFTLSLEQRFPPPEGSSVEEVRLSKFHFVDLAGSERATRVSARRGSGAVAGASGIRAGAIACCAATWKEASAGAAPDTASG